MSRVKRDAIHSLRGLKPPANLLRSRSRRTRESRGALTFQEPPVRFPIFALAVLLLFPISCSLEAALAQGEQGRRSYVVYCSNCHGVAGDGKGPSAPGLRPPPRDFRQGVFKWGSVPSGELPTDEDLLRIVQGGLRGTAMLPWSDIPEAELRGIISYVKTFSPRFRSGKPGKPVVASPDPWGESRRASAEERGRILYHGAAQCQSCHPAYATPESIQDEILAATGRPWTPRPDSGFAVPKETDFGSRLMPPDFRQERLRSIRPGKELGDLFRVIAAGVGGTAMPTWKGTLSDSDLWALAYYVDGLARSGEPQSRASHAR